MRHHNEPLKHVLLQRVLPRTELVGDFSLFLNPDSKLTWFLGPRVESARKGLPAFAEFIRTQDKCILAPEGRLVSAAGGSWGGDA